MNVRTYSLTSCDLLLASVARCVSSRICSSCNGIDLSPERASFCAPGRTKPGKELVIGYDGRNLIRMGDVVKDIWFPPLSLRTMHY